MLRDNSGFQISYSPEYAARIGADASAIDSRRACQSLVHLRPPAGYTYAVSGIGYAGTVSIESGVIGAFTSSLFQQGMPASVSLEAKLTGPRHGTWSRSTTIDPAQQTSNPCGYLHHLVVTNGLLLSPQSSDPTRPAPSTLSLAPTKSRASATFHLTWYAC